MRVKRRIGLSVVSVATVAVALFVGVQLAPAAVRGDFGSETPRRRGRVRRAGKPERGRYLHRRVRHARGRRVHGAIVSAGPPVLPLLMLSTLRRVSGRTRTVPLLFMRRGEELIVLGSNWARRLHPRWSENLLADPRCSVTVGRSTRPARARLLSANEADAPWPTLEAFCNCRPTPRARRARAACYSWLPAAGRSTNLACSSVEFSADS